MDQKSKFCEEAKLILNENNTEPFNDKEINQIIQLLEVFANVVCNNIKYQNLEMKNGERNIIH